MFALESVWFIRFIKDTDVWIIMTQKQTHSASGNTVQGSDTEMIVKWAELTWTFKSAKFSIMLWLKND